MSNSKNTQKNAKSKKKPLSDGTKVIIIIVSAVVVMAAILVVALCLPGDDILTIPEGLVSMDSVKSEIDSHEATDFAETSSKTNYVKLSVKDHGDIVIRLRPDVAPETVENFQDLVADGFYDGLTFHRIYKNFMIQGGDPDGDGTGDSGTEIKGEFTANGFTNNLKHVRGVISMARGEEMDSASCQFFICDATSAHLDGDYAAFGYVMAGMDVVDSIASVEVQANSKGELSDPLEDVIIEKIVFVEDSHNH